MIDNFFFHFSFLFFLIIGDIDDSSDSELKIMYIFLIALSHFFCFFLIVLIILFIFDILSSFLTDSFLIVLGKKDYYIVHSNKNNKIKIKCGSQDILKIYFYF